MKKVLILLSLLIGLMSCGKEGSNFKLEKGSKPYNIAKELSDKLPFLNPDSTVVIITTNDFVITSAEVMSNMYYLFGNRLDQFKNISPTELKLTIIRNADELAKEKVLKKKAKQAGIVITDAMVDSVLDAQYQASGGKEKFLEYIQRDSIPLQNVRDDIKVGLGIKKYLEGQLKDQIQVSEEEIKAAYEKDTVVTVRHILLLTNNKSGNDKMAVRKKMEKLLKRARKGEDFAELAKKYSEDPGSKERGGLYENFPKGQMVKQFEVAAFTTPVGEISDIVETRYGYHIIKVIDRKVGSKPYEEEKKEIKQKIEAQKFRKAYAKYMEKLKKEEGFELNKDV